MEHLNRNEINFDPQKEYFKCDPTYRVGAKLEPEHFEKRNTWFTVARFEGNPDYGDDEEYEDAYSVDEPLCYRKTEGIFTERKKAERFVKEQLDALKEAKISDGTFQECHDDDCVQYEKLLVSQRMFRGRMLERIEATVIWETYFRIEEVPVIALVGNVGL